MSSRQEVAAVSGPPRSSPYWPVLSNRFLRRLLPGMTLSSLGDGMAIVAISWLALDLAPNAQRGLWVAIAMAAYTLPSAMSTVLLNRFMLGRSGAQLAGWDAALRALALGAVPVAYLFETLNFGVYVALLALSSLLHSWGTAGRYTLIAEILPQRQHLPANAVLSTISEVSTVIGPPLAGVLIGVSGAVTVLAIDAFTFAVMALSYRLVARGRPPAPQERSPPHAGGFTLIRGDRTLRSLLALTFGFFFLFGPVYVALPIYVNDDLNASASVLGWYYTTFGLGAVIGGLVAGYLHRWPLRPTVIAIIIGFGTFMLPLGTNAPASVALVCFAVAGLIWAPYMSVSMTLFQRNVPSAALAQVLAANATIIVLSVPLGTLLGGPLVAVLGARHALLTCAVAIQILGIAAAIILLLERAGSTPGTATAEATRDGPSPDRMT
jgi:DHA3 family macrolide efflux protein-like MFS transporter